ncbi:MAG: TonB-dependent receptor [Crocinitomicaceae bacterium]|nr:TonB-dependent receptor [Crocinitomicaceae bacterium]
MNRISWLIIFLAISLPCFNSFSQEITILDKVTQVYIPGVKVYATNPKVQTLSDGQGKFNLELFSECDSVYVSYTSYETQELSVFELKGVAQIELTDQALSVSEMIVTANRWEQDKAKVPNRIAKLNMKDAELLGPQTTADLLETSGYVFVQKSQLAGGSPQLRGFGTNRVMITVDGVRMNNAIFRSGNLQNVLSLDANSLESAEVLFGPGAVMYGSDAIGGVMDFRSKKAQLITDSTRLRSKFNVFSRYSTASNESTTHFDFNYGKKKWAFMTAITFSKFGDLKTGSYGNSAFLRPSYQETINGVDSTLVNEDSNLQIGSGYWQANAIQKVYFKPSKEWSFDYGFLFSTTSDAPRYDRLTLDANSDGQLDNAEWYYGPQQWMMHRLTVVNTPVKNLLYDQMRLTVAYQSYRESRHDRKKGATERRNKYEHVDALSLNSDFDKTLSSRIKLFYGIEGVFNLVHSNADKTSIIDGSSYEINARYPDGSRWQTYGVYTKWNYSIHDKWILNTGIRYTIYDIVAKFDTSLFAVPIPGVNNSDGALNGTIGLVYNPNVRSQIYINGSSGFRAPNIDDIGKVFDSEPGSVVVPNVHLKPEYAYSAEFGFVKAIKNSVKLDGAVYYTYLKDALARTTFNFNGQDSILYDGVLSQVQAIQNISNAYVYGLQGGVELNLGKGFSLKSMISYQKGFEYNVDSASYFPKSHITPLYGRTALSYKRRHLRMEMYAVYHGRMNHDDLPLIERKNHSYALDHEGNSYTPSWYTLNIKATYFFNEHTSLNAGVENITDQLYRTFGSGISAPGRNFSLSLKVML